MTWYGINNSACSRLLSLFKQALPTPNTLPGSFYLAKKMIKNLGLDYNKIDVCQNRCMLYMNEHADDDICHVCTLQGGRKKMRQQVMHLQRKEKHSCRPNNYAFSVDSKVATILCLPRQQKI